MTTGTRCLTSGPRKVDDFHEMARVCSKYALLDKTSVEESNAGTESDDCPVKRNLLQPVAAARDAP